MMTAIRKSLRDFLFLIGLVLVAAAVAGYVLSNERLRFPFVQSKPFKLKAEFSTAQAVTPGQGQTVRVSGVRIGDIAKVDLSNGRATITMDVDSEYNKLVHTNATAFLRPKTGLKDMFIELTPGDSPAPVAKPGFTIPLQNTLPDINPDEILGALDADTRDYLKLLIGGAGQGLKGQGGNLREVLRRFEPTFRDLGRVNGMLSKRHTNLAHLIHGLNQLNTELATKGPQLAQLVNSSAAVFRAFASEQGNISRTVADLPGALHQTTLTLGKVQTFANVLGPTVEHLRPAARDLAPANRALLPLAKETTPIIRDQIRPFVRDSRPLVRSLKPASENLAAATPSLTRSFVVLNHLFNMLGFLPNGRQGPDVANRDQGLLFWLAWLGHNADAVFATADAHGPFRALTQTSTCATLKAEIQQAPATPIEFLQGLTGILDSPAFCGGSGPLPAIPNIPLPPILHAKHGANVQEQSARPGTTPGAQAPQQPSTPNTGPSTSAPGSGGTGPTPGGSGQSAPRTPSVPQVTTQPTLPKVNPGVQAPRGQGPAPNLNQNGG